MAKTKQREEMLEAFLDELSQSQSAEGLEQLFQNYFNQTMKLNNYPHVSHSYRFPDYKKRTRPLTTSLQQIELLDWEFDIPRAYIRELLAIPHHQLADELENFIINELANHHQKKQENTPCVHSRFIIALLLIQEIRSTKSLDVVLETLRQDATFFENYFDYSGCDLFPPLLYHIASNQLPKLLEFMKEPGILSFGKAYVATSVSNIASTTPERRVEVIEWYSQVLNFYYDHIDDKAIFDSLIIDSLAFDLLNIHGKELLPILEKIYATKLVMPVIAPDFKGIRKSIDKTETTVFGDLDIYQTLEELDALNFDYDEEGEEEPQVIREPVAPQCFTLKIALQGIKPEIWRLVEVPSTLTLPQLHEVIQAVMGWEDCHLHQFNKGKTYFMPEEQLDDQMVFRPTECYGYAEVFIDELFLRKGSKICYEYDFGDGWKHNVTLEARRPYKKDEQVYILLIDGANACPPEDCGGQAGYLSLCEAMKHKRTKAYKEYIEWLGSPFDPQAFGEDKEEIDEMLDGIL